MPNALFLKAHGGPENFTWQAFDPGAPGPDEARIRHEAVGLNFIDVYTRNGLYPIDNFPAILGKEGAGIVTAVGEKVTEVAVGDRVGYCDCNGGAYAEERLIKADRLIPLPRWLDGERAASVLLKGLTAQYLLRSTYPVKTGDTVLVHAAAGGVGLLLCQWAKHLGARVIGTVGSEEKAALARRYGCDLPILYRTEDFVEKTRAETEGKGVDAVYDCVGVTTFLGSLECLKPRGMLVSFGQAAGPIPPFDVRLLAPRSLFLARPRLFDYIAGREEMLRRATDLFDMLDRGALAVRIGQRFALKDGAAAHRALETRETTGATVLYL